MVLHYIIFGRGQSPRGQAVVEIYEGNSLLCPNYSVGELGS